MSPHELSTSGLLAAVAAGPGDQDVTFDELLERFRRRAFGVMILVATLPAFLPLPAGAGAISGPLVALFGAQMLCGLAHPWVPARWARRGIRRERFIAFLPLPAGAGAISGPLVALFGAQMLCGLAHPWVPARWARRGIRRERFIAFSTRMRPWLQRIERLVRPRWEILFDRLPGAIASGLLLLLLGLLLSLPIPLTNYPLGLLILAFAVALIERDGVLLAICWGLGLAASLATLSLSSNLLDWVRSLLA